MNSINDEKAREIYTYLITLIGSSISSICLEIKGSKKITDTKVPIAVMAGDDNSIVALKSEKIKDNIETKKIPLDANKKEITPRRIILFLENRLLGFIALLVKLTSSRLDILS